MSHQKEIFNEAKVFDLYLGTKPGYSSTRPDVTDHRFQIRILAERYFTNYTLIESLGVYNSGSEDTFILRVVAFNSHEAERVAHCLERLSYDYCDIAAQAETLLTVAPVQAASFRYL